MKRLFFSLLTGAAVFAACFSSAQAPASSNVAPSSVPNPPGVGADGTNVTALLTPGVTANDPALIGLQLSVAKLESEFAALKQSYSAEHPLYKEAQARLTSMRNSLNEAVLRSQNTHAAALDAALEEEVNLDLDSAMNSYQSVISQFDSQRASAANAIFRLGECYRKQGRLEEAKVQYGRILREFSDQGQFVELSQKHLFSKPSASGGGGRGMSGRGGMSGGANFGGRGAGGGAGFGEGGIYPGSTPPPMWEFRRRYGLPGETGAQALDTPAYPNPPNELSRAMPEYMKRYGITQKQWEGWQSDDGTAPTTSAEAAEISDSHRARYGLPPEGQAFRPSPRARERQKAAKMRRLLEQDIKLVESQVGLLQRQVDNGLESSASLIPLQREILKLQRELAEYDDDPPSESLPPTPAADPAAPSQPAPPPKP